MRYIVAAITVIGLLVSLQQAPPSTEIFLASISPETGRMQTWSNISNSPGYDNQPSFLPDSSALLFSSNRDGKQMDIYRYDIASKTLKQLTNTVDNEFSPTVTPDGKSFSVIRQAAADGTQLLVKYDLSTGVHQSVVFENVKPVGYHAWIDPTHVAMFILGSGQGAPATLQIGDTKTGTAEVVATGIGRSILIRPGTGTVSYITTGQARMIRELDPKSRASKDVVAPLGNSQDASWLPDGRLLMASGPVISVWKPGAADWQRWDGTEPPRIASPVTGPITRLAASPDGRWLAFVAEPAK